MGVDSHVRVLTQGVMLDGSPEIRGMPQGQILGVDLGEDRSDLVCSSLTALLDRLT